MLNLPEGAKEVFKGQRCTIYHWPQRMFDGREQTFEIIVRPPTATILPVVDGKLWMMEQRQPHRQETFFCFPGGIADVPGEDILTAAKRELLEETGLASDDWEAWQVTGSRGYVLWENHIFIARSCARVAEPHPDGGEDIECFPVTFDEFLARLDDPLFRHKDLLVSLYQIREDPGKREAFRQRLGI